MSEDVTIGDYDVWLAALEDGGINCNPPAGSKVGAGFWRLPTGKGNAQPVATWFDGAGWEVLFGSHAFNDTDRTQFLKFADVTWPKLQAVGSERYDDALEKGVWWDNVPVKAPVKPEVANPSVAPAEPGMGHNEPPDDALIAQYTSDLDELIAKAMVLAKKGAAKTQAEADAAANLKTSIRDLRSDILAEHKVKKAPILKAYRDIDTLYFTQRDRCTKLEDRLHDAVVKPFLLAEQQKRFEEQEAARKAAEAANEKPPEAPPRPTAGAKGRKDGLRKRIVGTINDFDAFYAAVKDHQPVREWMAEYAQKNAANWREIGAVVPGLSTSEEYR